MNIIEQILHDLHHMDGNVWSLHLCPTGGHIGLHNIELDFELLQTPAGSLSEIITSAHEISVKLEENSKPYTDAINRIVPLQKQLRSSGDTKFFEEISEIVNDCRKLYESKQTA